MQTVLITGATSGIGKAFAYEYAKNGARLVLTARRDALLNEIANDLEQKYQSNCMVIPMDLSEPGAAVQIKNKVNMAGWNVDILINDAGFPTKGLLEKSDLEKQHRELMVNVIALTELTHQFIGEMAARGEGVVINIASAAAFNPCPFNSVYAATKAYVLSFSQAIRYEYLRYGVKVLTVCPQATDTHFFDDFNKMGGTMRSAEDVVRTTKKALKHNRSVALDGSATFFQSLMPRIFTRKMRVRITGSVCGKVWGN